MPASILARERLSSKTRAGGTSNLDAGRTGPGEVQPPGGKGTRLMTNLVPPIIGGGA